MNSLRVFHCQWCSNDREAWCEITTIRRGEDFARTSVVSADLGRRLMSALIARYGGFYRGVNFIREDGRGVSQ